MDTQHLSPITYHPTPITHHPSPKIYGIRHHGPGSSRALLASLEEWGPDIILIEGPADGTDLLPWLAKPEMEPPVAMLVYRPDQPRRSGYFPYAVFSPEYQAARFALEQEVPVRLFDLPQSVMLASDHGPAMPDKKTFELLAQATGYTSYEAWWNGFVEQRQDGRDLFDSILLLMQEMRLAAEQHNTTDIDQSPEKEKEQAVRLRLAEQREAHMRQEIRRAQKEGYQRIAVVCGAWHGPALIDLQNEAADVALLTDMPQVEVDIAWVPWTYGRLATFSGYGAGIRSPGWYHHLWEMGRQNHSRSETAALWLSTITQLLRQEGFDASSAHVIEALRLAQSLAALRDITLPGLPELNEATQAVICGGEAEPMRLIQKRLIVGERMGLVPPDAPLVPLQRDLYAQMRALKLRPEPEESLLKLDLRHEQHLQRSQLLHRLKLLKIPWGKTIKARGSEGTFNEVWQLKWRPDFAVRIVEANLWGNTVIDAAGAFAADQAQQAIHLPTLTSLLDEVILADLPPAIEIILHKIQEASALNRDILHMMGAIPPLARIMRYGDIRQTDQALVAQVVETLLIRVCVGLPSSCRQLDDKAAEEMLSAVINVHGVVSYARSTDLFDSWYATLAEICQASGVHGLVAGRMCRMLMEGGRLNDEETISQFEQALSPTYAQKFDLQTIRQAAAWLDGFLRGANLLLIHDHQLWDILDRWVMRLSSDRFEAVVPLLRRTFYSLSEATRRQLAERVYHGQPSGPEETLHQEVDPTAADAILPVLSELLGISDSNKWEETA